MLKYICRPKTAEYAAGRTVFTLTVRNDFMTVQNDFMITKEFRGLIMIDLKKKLHSQTFRSLIILWGAVAISVLIVFFPFLTGDGLVVWNDAGSDTRQQYLMHYATIVNHLKNGNYSLWDMNLGFGASLFALNPFHLFLLPVYLLGALFGAGHIPTFLLFMMIAQFFLAGTFCYLFLSCFSLSESGNVIAAYLYTFCGYLLVWGQHYHFGAFAVFLPLLLFLLERAMQRHRFSPAVPLVVALMVCSSTYMSYMSLLMAGAYLLYRAILENGAPARRARMFLARCGEILLGLGLGAFAFLPSVRFLTTVSSRLGAEGSFLGRMWKYCSLFPAEFYRTAFLRFFSTTFEGIAQYSGYSNFYEAPVLFFGVLFVILFPQYLFSIRRQEVSRKAKILQYVAVLFFVFCMFVRLGASVFNGFAYPFSRHSFIFMPLFALVTARALDNIRLRRHLSIPALVLSAALLVCACCTALPRLSAAEPYGWNIVTDVIATGALGALMILLLVLLARKDRKDRDSENSVTLPEQPEVRKRRSRRMRRVATVLLFLCVIANVTGEGWLCYNARDVLTTTNADYWGPLYDPDVDAALAWLKENDPTFWRLEKDYYAGSYCMDALEQDYRGVSAYNSTPNSGVEEFVNLVIPNFPIMARYEYTFRQIGYYSGHSTLFGVKYLLSRSTDPKPDGFRQIGEFGNLYLYQNDNVSSFARFYTKAGDSAVLKEAYGKADLETMLLDVALLDAGDADADSALASVQELGQEDLLSPDELLSQYALEEIAALDDVTADGDSDSVFLRLEQNDTQIADPDADQIAEQATDPNSGSLVDRSYYEHVYLEFDIETPNVCDFALNPGSTMEYLFRTKSGETTHVQMPVPSFCKIFRLHSYSGPFSAQISNVRLLGSKTAPAQAPQADIVVNDTANDSQLTGTVSTEEDGLLFLPLPYEEGWTASVDGEAAKLLRTDLGFISIPVTAGDHNFTLTYHQPWMRVGFCVSIFSFVLWGILIIIQERKRRGH